MNRVFVISIFLLLSFWLSGQVQVSITTDRDSVGIGDPITIHYLFQTVGTQDVDLIDFTSLFQMENLVYTQDTNLLDKTADIGVLSSGDLKFSSESNIASTKGLWQKSNEGNQLEGNVKIGIYNVGAFALGPPAFPEISSDKQVPLEPRIILVSPPEGMTDSLTLAPIKPIIEEPILWQDYLPYLYVLLGILTLILLGRFLFRKQKPKPTMAFTQPEVRLPSEVIALQKLKILELKELWQKGEIKAYQSELTYIIREYLEGRFDIAALELTTGEILSALSNKDFDQVHAKNLENILQMADLIKFAKANPTEDIHSKFMDMAVAFIQDTKKINEPI